MRTCFFDMETTGFNADFGRMMCAVVKEPRRRPVVIEAKVYDDFKACIRLRNKLESYNILVAHYGKGFDIPFLQSRLLIQNQRHMDKRFFIDTYFIARQHFGKAIKSKSLEALADVLGLNEELQKIKVRRQTWNEARDGNEEARNLIVERCIGDVLTLEAVYNKLCPYVDTLSKFG